MIDGDSTYTTGNDTIYARDDEQDTITCGFGADTVQADLLDVVTDQIDCEQVDRQQLTPPTITPQPTPGTPAPSTPGLTPLTVAPVKVTAPRLAALTRSGAVTVRAKPTAAARCTATLIALAPEAKRLKLGKKALVIGRSPATKIAANTLKPLRITLTAPAKRKLRTAKLARTRLTVTCTAPGTKRAVRTRALVLRR